METSIFLLLNIILLAVVFFLHLTSPSLRWPWRFNGEGPPSYPIIGCLISFYMNRHRLLDWYTELLSLSSTNTIVVRRLGAPRTVVTANPDNVEHILRTNFANFPKGKPFTEILGDFLGHGIFNVDGELWRAQRKLASHLFTTRSMRELVMSTLVEEVNGHLLPVLESLAETRRTVDLQELLRRLSFNIISKVSLGMELCLLDPSQPALPIATAFDMASLVSARRGASPVFLVWKIKRWAQMGSEKKLKKAVEEVHSQVEMMIKDRKKKMNEWGDNDKQDLLTGLVLAGNDDDVTRDMVISFIMAGRDTTSAAMTWLFWLLSQHPNIEQELVKEITTFRETNLHYESLKELNFLKACICESMRLFPPVAWDSKHAIYDDVLPDGTPVRAGDRVTYFPYGMGRMATLWGSDVLEFNPDRWFELEQDRTHHLKEVSPFKFPVFQAGPRVCLGKEMAFVQMKYIVGSVLKRFVIQPAWCDKPAFVPLLTAHMAGGLKVMVQKRESD